MELLNRRREMGSHLPYDYEVEYLQQSSVDQYIDTNIVDTGGYVFKGDFSVVYPTQTVNFSFLYGYSGSWSSNSRACRIQYDGYRVLYVWYNTGEIQLQRFNSTEIVVEDAPTHFKVNDTVYITRSRKSISNTKPVLLFKAASSNFYSQTKCRSFQILNEGVVLLHFIPVVKDNIGYMYDKVSKQLFCNAGTGQFILGPRISSGGGVSA